MEGTTVNRDAHRQADCLCSRIVRSLADATGTDSLELDPPLYHAVDVEALTRLVESDAPVTVEFRYDGHDVVVEDGAVAVDGIVYEA